MSNSYQQGSVWRKWDLQVHVPGAEHADAYKTDDKSDPWPIFLDRIKNSDVTVFGIADYFSIAGYEELLKRAERGCPVRS